LRLTLEDAAECATEVGNDLLPTAAELTTAETDIY
jgi:hypothetical protein